MRAISAALEAGLSERNGECASILDVGVLAKSDEPEAGGEPAELHGVLGPAEADGELLEARAANFGNGVLEPAEADEELDEAQDANLGMDLGVGDKAEPPCVDSVSLQQSKSQRTIRVQANGETFEPLDDNRGAENIEAQSKG